MLYRDAFESFWVEGKVQKEKKKNKIAFFIKDFKTITLLKMKVLHDVIE